MPVPVTMMDIGYVLMGVLQMLMSMFVLVRLRSLGSGMLVLMMLIVPIGMNMGDRLVDMCMGVALPVH